VATNKAEKIAIELHSWKSMPEW